MARVFPKTADCFLFFFLRLLGVKNTSLSAGHRNGCRTRELRAVTTGLARGAGEGGSVRRLLITRCCNITMIMIYTCDVRPTQPSTHQHVQHVHQYKTPISKPFWEPEITTTMAMVGNFWGYQPSTISVSVQHYG